MFQDIERAHQAMMHSQINRNIIKNNLNTDSNIKPQEVVVESDNMWQIILIDPTQDYQKAIPQVIIPIIFQENRQQLKYLAGMMLKKSSHFIIGFQKKYCTLDNRKLNYYKQMNKYKLYHSDKPNQLEGSLNFDLQEYLYLEKRNDQNQIIEFKLIPKGCKNKFIFKNENLQETLIWAKTIQEHLNQSDGKIKQITYLSKIPKFWKHYQLSYLQVQEECDNGDIVLFKSKGSIAAASRMFLGWKFDHVGILYKENQQLFVYEAVQTGVGTFRWGIQYIQIRLFKIIRMVQQNNLQIVQEQFPKIKQVKELLQISLFYLKKYQLYKYYEKICIRKLNYSKKNDPGVQQRFLNFINENIGNDYNLNIGKLFRFTSKIKTTSNDKKEEKKRSFFCSELVAKAYKEMGLIDQVKSSTQYHPNDFTQDKQLCLLNGAALGPEYLVLFEG